MGEVLSKSQAEQQAAAKTALADMCGSVAKAIIELSKLEGPIESEAVVAHAAKKVLELCEQQTERSVQEISQIIKREKLAKLLRAAEGNERRQQNLPAELLFLELLKVALDDASDSGSSSGSSSGDNKQSETKVSIAHPWTRQNTLGKGAFGQVYSAVDKKGLKFAVKEVPRDGVEEQSIREEMKLLGQFSHQNIVKIYGCAGDEEKIYMYMELMQGSIKDKMENSGQPISEHLAKKYTRDLMRGLLYLHSRDVVHCDIKCANILLDARGNAKLADMGISRKHDHPTKVQYSADIAGTLLWMSPEQIQGSESGKRSDVWSVGCTVYEMVTGEPPFCKELSPILFPFLLPKMIQNLEHRKLVANHENLGNVLKAFLLRIFVAIEKRPYAEAIAGDPWLK